MHKGVFITFEGGEGVGKSTQIALLADRLRQDFSVEVCLVREPGGTEVGEKIRNILLDKEQSEMNSMTELFLYEAARAQIVSDVIEPALAAGQVVLCDRYIDSTVAYQGYARGLGVDVVKTLNQQAIGDTIPDCTLLLVLDPEQGVARASKVSEQGADRIESAGQLFHQRVLEGFTELAAENPNRIRIIDAAGTIEAVHAQIWECIKSLFLTERDR